MMDSVQAEFVQQMHNDGEDHTVVVPGMIRWEDADGDGYFIKHPREGSEFFVLGSEYRGKYSTSVAIFNSDMKGLIENLAKFAGLKIEVTE